MKTKLLFAILSLLTFSCIEKSEESTVIGYNFRPYNDNVWYTLEYQQTSMFAFDDKILKLREAGMDINERAYLIRLPANREYISFNNLVCKLQDSIDYEEIRVYRYLYDIENSIDEEFYIFISDKNELIAIKSQAWGGYELFGDTTIWNQLRMDSTNFF